MRVSRGPNASNGVEIVTCLYFYSCLLGKARSVSIPCHANPSQLLASSGRYRTNPRKRQFSRSSRLAGKQPPPARKLSSAAHVPATAAALMITHWGDMSSLIGADLFALESIQQSSKAISW
jgi:hypothetical protein